MGKRKFDIFGTDGSQPTFGKSTSDERVGPVNQLLGSAALEVTAQGQKITFIPRHQLSPLPMNDEVYSVRDLEATARDIAVVGIRQPLVVFKNETGNYSVLAGNRRLAASELAIKEFGATCESLPCIIQPAPKTAPELRKRMIKDNLQREKSGYERMREILVYQESVEEEWRLNGEIEHPNMRDVLMSELGVSQSEITRYLKISKQLIPELMDCFKKTTQDNVELIKTSVAFKLASQAPVEMQKFVFENHNWEEPLTDATSTTLMAEYLFRNKPEEGAKAEIVNPVEPAESTDSPVPIKQKQSPLETYKLTSVHEGVTRLEKACSSLRESVPETSEFSDKVAQRLMKKIATEMVKIESLSKELQKYLSAAQKATETETDAADANE